MVRHEAGTWGLTHELLAQLIEEVSVLAADRRRKEPRAVPRPDAVSSRAGQGKPAVNAGVHQTPSGGVQAVGLAGMLGMASSAGAAVNPHG